MKVSLLSRSWINEKNCS